MLRMNSSMHKLIQFLYYRMEQRRLKVLQIPYDLQASRQFNLIELRSVSLENICLDLRSQEEH